jgi:RNA 3'-terminal phosphate cyclase (ATP)
LGFGEGGMIILDGSLGEGGGQILRTALTLSMVTGQPFRLNHIRAGRRRPGLLRQHLMCVEAATAISGACTEGATSGSQTLVFDPTSPKPNSLNSASSHPGMQPAEYAFRIASAGSSTLVFQTVVPALLRTGHPFVLELAGGTHNSAAPSFDFLAQTYAPCLAAMGVTCTLQLRRRGFYPAGGGDWRAAITPAQLKPLHWLHRSDTGAPQAKLYLSRMAARIAEYERDQLADGLGLSRAAVIIEADDTSPGPGCVGIISLPASPIPETITLFGGYGSHTESATQAALDEARQFLAHDAPVGMHLADQLMVLLAVGAGGSYRTGPLSSHAETNTQVIEAFAPGHLSKTIDASGCVTLQIKPVAN